ncbi:MAG: hypothetical protein IJH57_03860 [Mogibacterium sp.]|nr:hypothetical protein [Mogibacterium sp.]
MKKTIAILVALIMILSMVLALSSCKKEEPAPQENAETTEEQKTEDAADKDAGDKDAGDIVTSFNPDAEDVIEQDLPMQIESVTLYKDGSIKIVPLDDLKKNAEINKELKEGAMYPFADSGKAKDMYLLRIGNGGYRTIVALMDDGTVSAINTRAMIEDHILEVSDNLGGRDSFTSVEQEENEYGFSIVGKTKEGDDVLLDPIILPDNEEPLPIEE